MSSSRRFNLLAGCCVFALCSCVGTEVGNPQDEFETEIDFTTQEQALNEVDEERSLHIDKAWLAVESIELRDASDCDGEDVKQLEGPFALDLIGGRELPQKPAFSNHGQGFCKMKIRMRPLLANIDGAPSELTETSLSIQGERPDGVPFTVRIDINETHAITARDEGGFSLDRASALLVNVDLTALLTEALSADDIDLEGGEILVDQKNNQSAQAKIKQSLRASFKLFDDRDRDQQIGSDQDRLLAEGELSP